MRAIKSILKQLIVLLLAATVFAAGGDEVYFEDIDTATEINALTTDADFLTAEVDGSITNEIQDLSIAGDTLSLSGDTTTVDLSGYYNSETDVASTITRDTEWDTEAEVQTAWGSVNILLETEIDASSELATLMDDETGTAGNLVFSNTPTLVTPVIGLATGTSLDLGATTLYGSRAITVDTGGVLNIDIGSAAGDDFTVDTSKLIVEGDTGNVGIGTASPSGKLHATMTMATTGNEVGYLFEYTQNKVSGSPTGFRVSATSGTTPNNNFIQDWYANNVLMGDIDINGNLYLAGKIMANGLGTDTTTGILYAGTNGGTSIINLGNPINFNDNGYWSYVGSRITGIVTRNVSAANYDSDMTLSVGGNGTSQTFLYAVSGTTPTASLNPNGGGVIIGGTTPTATYELTVNNDIYAVGDVSALTFTDRASPIPAGRGATILDDIKKIKIVGTEDKSTLPDYIRHDNEVNVYEDTELKAIPQEDAFETVMVEQDKTVPYFDDYGNRVDKKILTEEKQILEEFTIEGGKIIEKFRTESIYEKEFVPQTRLKKDIYFDSKTGLCYQKVGEGEIKKADGKIVQIVKTGTKIEEGTNLGMAVSMLIVAVQEQQKKIEELQKKVK